MKTEKEIKQLRETLINSKQYQRSINFGVRAWVKCIDFILSDEETLQKGTKFAIFPDDDS